MNYQHLLKLFPAEAIGISDIFLSSSIYVWARIAQSVYRLATGWKVRGSKPGGGEILRTYPDRPWDSPSLLYNGYRVFPGGKAGRGVKLTTHPHLVPRSWKNTAVTLLPLWAHVACYRVKPLPYLTFHLCNFYPLSKLSTFIRMLYETVEAYTLDCLGWFMALHFIGHTLICEHIQRHIICVSPSDSHMLIHKLIHTHYNNNNNNIY
jgi:hypothetical protein